MTDGDGFEDDRDAYAEVNIFFVPEDARWDKIKERITHSGDRCGN